MKKALTLFAFAVLIAAQASARYVVVLKSGARYNAKAKWTVVNGRAIVNLENGQSLQLDPALIDAAKSEEATNIGIKNAKVLDLDPNMPAGGAPTAQKPSLGTSIKLRTPAQQKAAAVAKSQTVATAPVPTTTPGVMPQQVIDNFDRAFENVGIFEKKIVSTGGRSLRAELTLDTEDKVFNAISASAYLMMRNAGVESAQIDMVELFMKTTTGGAAGRFQMSRADAEALNNRRISQQDYFVRNVIY